MSFSFLLSWIVLLNRYSGSYCIRPTEGEEEGEAGETPREAGLLGNAELQFEIIMIIRILGAGCRKP